MPAEHAILAEIPRLRRYARALTGNDADADDLLQDTLERALGKWLLWRPGNLRAWLLTMMHHVFLNQLRHRPPLVTLDEDTPAIPVRPQQQDELDVRDLDRALGRLPPEQREVLLLVGLEELSYADTARILGIPPGTVMSRLSRARERLRAILAGEDRPMHLKVVK
ncbi:sigma-70 family RNA polymerase sigma factor [Zoogloea sp.]|uniref:sigma-70 family RNA polymerase sigma factor n=1 Tax=Zoogloea sp. TaxID=49181 RepID=UPI0035AFF02F